MRAALFLSIALAAGMAAAPAAAVAPAPWTTVWLSPTFPLTPNKIPMDMRSYDGQTVRQTLRLGAATGRIRVKLTNELNPAALAFGAVRIARLDAAGAAIPGSERILTFSGREGGLIPPGAPLYSDPVDFPAPALGVVAISVYYPGPATPAAHLSRVEVAPGDQTARPALADARTARAPALASEIDAALGPDPARRVVVAFGDSITEGAGSTPGAFKSWPDQFADRLAGLPEGRHVVVLNAGISGNRLLHDGAGPNALARFDRDALDAPGVTDVILLEGVNDIGWGSEPAHQDEQVGVDALIAADRQLAERAHGRGVRIWAGLLTPYEGAVYYDPAGETKREALNRWIRGGGAFDGVIDFDAAVRDPADPLRYRPADDHGDHLHPSDEGYRVMAQTIDPALFATGAPHPAARP